jgi:glycosyltransferase involved in cell wall biosynthesis
MVVGFIGRLVPEKGVDDLVTLVELLRDRPVTLAVWGAGPLLPSLESGLGGTGRILGPLDYHDVATALHACDVLLVPSRRTATWEEQLGRVAVEAMMCGRPVVAYATGALPDVVGEGGILLREGDILRLAEAVRQLAESPERRRSLGEKACRWVRSRWSPERAAETLVAFWEEVLRR